METIKIKYFDDRHAYDGVKLTRLQKIKQGNMIDLYAAEDMWFEKGDFRLIPLGVAMQLPEGYIAKVYPRSSTYKKWHILMANSTGIIDETYCGDEDEWLFPAYATENTMIHKGDKICQFEIVKKMPEVQFDEVEILGNDNRGGIGSTGTR